MASDGLPMVLELGTFLVIEITETAREVEMIVYTTVLHFLPRRYDPLHFQRILWFMIIGQLNYLPRTTKSSPRITSVGHI